MPELVIELLTKAHDRKSFDCGKTEQNEFLKTKARRHGELNYSKTWVAAEHGQSHIYGFVTLSMHSIAFNELTEESQRGLPLYPMPVLHVGQVGTDLRAQGRGVGTLLLRFAAEKAIELSETLGCYGMELIADNQKALEWYKSRGFIPLAKDSLKLFLPVETLKRAQLG